MHISIGDLNKQLCMFNHQKALAHELLIKLQCQPFTYNFVLIAFLGDFINIKNIYHSHECAIQMTIQLLRTEPAFNILSAAYSH